MKATREALGDILPLLGEKYHNIVALDCDIGKATKLDQFGKKFPDRFFQMGIAEANAIGVASGLAAQGFKPFLASFASFLTGRYDQIRCSIAYPNMPVVLIGTHVGMAIGRDGVTQMGLEDIALMNALPNMQIFNPASYNEACTLIENICDRYKLYYPTYIRLGRQPVEEIFRKGENAPFVDLTPGTSQTDITVYSTGCITHEVMKAIKLVDKKTIQHIHVTKIKPLSIPLPRGNIIVSVEDHTVMGGFGSILSHHLHKPVVKIGIGDTWVESGKPDDLYKKYGLDAISIAEILTRVS